MLWLDKQRALHTILYSARAHWLWRVSKGVVVDVVMGCGYSTYNRRVAAAQKEKGQVTSVEVIGGVAPITPKTITSERNVTPVPSLPEQRREFLQGMSPPSSPTGGSLWKSTPVATVASEPAVVPAITGVSPPAVALENMNYTTQRAGCGGGGGGDGGDGDAAVSGVAPSNGGRQTGEAEAVVVNDRNGNEVGHTWETRSIELASQPGEFQIRLPRVSGQDPLPQIVPSTRGSANLSSILSRGNTLGAGLDIGFREDPTDVVATTTTGLSSRARSSSNKRTEDRPTPSQEPKAKRSDSTCREEFLVAPVTPDELGEDAMSEHRAVNDRWPRDRRDQKSPAVIRRGDYRDTDDDGPPPRLEARPAVAANTSGGVGVATGSINPGGRGGLTVADFPDDNPDNDLSAEDGMISSEADGTWGAASGAFSLLDADEEDFMETLLMES